MQRKHSLRFKSQIILFNLHMLECKAVKIDTSLAQTLPPTQKNMFYFDQDVSFIDRCRQNCELVSFFKMFLKSLRQKFKKHNLHFFFFYIIPTPTEPYSKIIKKKCLERMNQKFFHTYRYLSFYIKRVNVWIRQKLRSGEKKYFSKSYKKIDMQARVIFLILCFSSCVFIKDFIAADCAALVGSLQLICFWFGLLVPLVQKKKIKKSSVFKWII